MDRISKATEYFDTRINEVNKKLTNDLNTIESVTADKEILTKKLYSLTSENVHHNRTLEKNKLFKENTDEKNVNTKNRNQEKFKK